MNRDKLVEALKSLESKTVTKKGNACNSLNLQIAETRFWIDPSWRYEKDNNNIIASGDFAEHSSFSSEKEYEDDFHNCCNKSDELKGSILLKASLESNNDLVLEFSGNQILRTFHTFITDKEENWYISNRTEGYRYLVFPNLIEFEAVTHNK